MSVQNLKMSEQNWLCTDIMSEYFKSLFLALEIQPSSDPLVQTTGQGKQMNKCKTLSNWLRYSQANQLQLQNN